MVMQGWSSQRHQELTRRHFGHLYYYEVILVLARPFKFISLYLLYRIKLRYSIVQQFYLVLSHFWRLTRSRNLFYGKWREQGPRSPQGILHADGKQK